MHYFYYKNNQLYCESIKVKQIAEKFGTPLYIYSKKTILHHYNQIKNGFAKLNPLICYSVKANSNLMILKILKEQGAGFDIVSGGELFRINQLGVPGEKIVYASVGKTEKEIEEAIKYGILMFNVESEEELERIKIIAKKKKYKQVKVSLRINPDVDARTHGYITTGKKETKFGIDFATAGKILKKKNSFTPVVIAGLHLHIGSQITEFAPFAAAINKCLDFLKNLGSKGGQLEYLNLGGGMGINYYQEKAESAEKIGQKISNLVAKVGKKIIIEPGRYVVGNAGILVVKVLYRKKSIGKDFIIVDGAMNDLLRPSLYGAYHEIRPIINPQRKSRVVADIVGPICESGDFLGKNRKIKVNQGEYLAVFSAGAYGMSMSSNYNSRCRAAEILVDGNKVMLIRQRESYQDLIAKEKIL